MPRHHNASSEGIFLSPPQNLYDGILQKAHNMLVFKHIVAPGQQSVTPLIVVLPHVVIHLPLQRSGPELRSTETLSPHSNVICALGASN